MADNKDKSTDRRTLIAAAVAATALPFMTTETKAQAGGTRVVVDLGGVDLSEEIATKLENDIRRAVLMAVAQAAPRTKFKSLPLPKGALGIVLQRV